MRKIFLFPRGSCLRSAGCIIYRRWYSGGERRRVSCLPWVDFRHFSVHSYDKKDSFFPSVAAGKMTEIGGKWSMPLSLTAMFITDCLSVTLCIPFPDLSRDGLAACFAPWQAANDVADCRLLPFLKVPCFFRVSHGIRQFFYRRCVILLASWRGADG